MMRYDPTLLFGVASGKVTLGFEYTITVRARGTRFYPISGVSPEPGPAPVVDTHKAQIGMFAYGERNTKDAANPYIYRNWLT